MMATEADVMRMLRERTSRSELPYRPDYDGFHANECDEHEPVCGGL